MSAILPKDGKKMLLVLLLDLVITFGIGSLPGPGEITPIGMQYLGILFGCIICWLFGYLGWGSVIALLLMACWVPGNTLNGVISGAYGHQTLLMIVFCFVFCHGLQKLGLLPFLANSLLSTKFATKSPWHLAVIFWLAGIICAGLTVPIATLVFLYSLWYKVADQVGIQRKSTYCAVVMIFLGTLVAISLVLMPYSAGLWMTKGFIDAVAPGLEMNLLKVLIPGWILIFGTFAELAVLLKVLMKTGVVKTEFSMADTAAIVNKDDLRMTTSIKIAFGYIVLLLAMMILPSVLPTTIPVIALLKNLGTTGCFMVICVLMCFTPVEGEYLFTFEDGMKNGLSWGVYFMLATAYLLSGLVVAQNTGVTATILPVVQSILPADNPWIIMAAFMLVGLIMTNCITNFVCMQMLIPLGAMVLIPTGVNPMIFAAVMQAVLDHGNMMPSGSPMGALMHGSSEWISSGQVYLWAFVGSIAVYLVSMGLATPLALLLG